MGWNVGNLDYDGWGCVAYNDPQLVGWEVMGEVSWSEPNYDFDLTVLWRDIKTGQLFWASDSGCSCPAPFEDYTSSDMFETGTRAEFLNYLQTRHAAGGSYVAGQIAQLTEKVLLGGL